MNLTIRRNKTDECIRLSARLSSSPAEKELWFEVPAAFEDHLTSLADPFVIASIFPAMEAGETLYVDGCVSRALLRNIREFQQAWAAWKPSRYRMVSVEAMGVEPEVPSGTEAICAFTGGIDGAWVLFDNVVQPQHATPYPIGAFVYVHGFHIPPEQRTAADAHFDKLKNIGDELGIASICVRTNLRSAGYWHDTHGAAVAACLALFQRSYSTALIGSSHPYQYLRFPWGSNAITDALLSTGNMRIVNYGAGYNRVEKIRRLIPWQSFQQAMVVCTRAYNGNCGRCEKCIRTQLGYWALGENIPPAFPARPSLWQVLTLVAYKQQEIMDYGTLYHMGKRQRHKHIFLALRANIFFNMTIHYILNMFGRTELPPVRRFLRQRRKKWKGAM